METDICTLLPGDAIKLCERYLSINVETLIITFSREKLSISHMGSYLGKEFLKKNNKIPQMFLEFCKGILDTSDTDKRISNCMKESQSVPTENVLVSKRSCRRRKQPSWIEDYVDSKNSKVKKLTSINVIKKRNTASKDKSKITEIRPEKVVEKMSDGEEDAIASCGDPEIESSYNDNCLSSIKSSNEMATKLDEMSREKIKENSSSPQEISNKVQNDKRLNQNNVLGQKIVEEEMTNTICTNKEKEIVTKKMKQLDTKQCMVKRKFGCKICGQMLCSKRQLHRHLKFKHDHIVTEKDGLNTVQIFRCNKCSKEFHLIDQLRVHLENSHHSLAKETDRVDHNTEEGEQDDLDNEKTRETPAVPEKCEDSEKLTQSMETTHEPEEQNHQRLNFSCRFCQKQFPTSWTLNIHRKSHIDDMPYSCEICNEKFKYKPNHFCHLLLKHRSHFCPVCKLVLTDEDKMKEHHITCAVNRKKEIHRCPLCFKKLRTASGFDAHLKKHDCSYECDVCKHTLVTLSSFKRHRSTHCGIKNHACHLCGTMFSQKEYLDKHLRRVHGVYKGKKLTKAQGIKCKLCEKELTSKSKLVEHINAAHMSDILQKLKPNSRYTCKSSDEEMKCPVCAIMCSNESEYILHLTRHATEHKSTFICEHCGKQFQKKAQLKNHQIMHTDEKPYPCEKCGKTFRAKSTLVSHVYTHRDYHEFICDICGSSFKSVPSLRAHIKSHDRTRFHSCKYCPRQFRSFDGLKTHWLSEHPNEINVRKLKVYSCQFCPKVFATSQCHKRHVATHTGEKNEECDVCHAKFATVSQLNAHRKMTHFGEKKLICTACNVKFFIPSKMKRHLSTSKHKETCLRKGLDLKIFETVVEMAIKDNEDNCRNRKQIDKYLQSSSNEGVNDPQSSSNGNVNYPEAEIKQSLEKEEVLEIEVLTKDQAIPIKNESENVIGYIVIENLESGEQREVTELDQATTEALHSILI